MKYLLDTNVISELRKIPQVKGNSGVEDWSRSINRSDLSLSSMTILELTVGVLRLERKDAQQGARLRYRLERQVLVDFAERIYDADRNVAQAAAGFQIPDPMESLDALIAATALVHGMTLVTRNERHFAPTGVRVLNPFT